MNPCGKGKFINVLGSVGRNEGNFIVLEENQIIIKGRSGRHFCPGFVKTRNAFGCGQLFNRVRIRKFGISFGGGSVPSHRGLRTLFSAVGRRVRLPSFGVVGRTRSCHLSAAGGSILGVVEGRGGAPGSGGIPMDVDAACRPTMDRIDGVMSVVSTSSGSGSCRRSFYMSNGRCALGVSFYGNKARLFCGSVSSRTGGGLVYGMGVGRPFFRGVSPGGSSDSVILVGSVTVTGFTTCGRRSSSIAKFVQLFGSCVVGIRD